MKLIRQFDGTDCGAACLAIVASHYKAKYSVTSIREIAGTDTHGTNLAGLVKAGEAMGFSVQVLKGDKEALSQDLPLPFIVHIKKCEEKREFFHFVVVKKIKNKKLTIYDPSGEKKKIDIEEFAKTWTGYTVFLRPSAEFKIQDNTKGFFERFAPLLKPYIHEIIQVIIASFLLTFFGIISSLYFRYIIDDVVYSKAFTSLTSLSIGIIILTLFSSGLSAVRSHIILFFSLKMDYHLIFSYFKHVFSLPIKFFDTRKTGEILSRINDAQKVRSALSGTAVSVVIDSCMVIIAGVVLYFKSPFLFWIGLITVPLSSIIIWLFSKKFAKGYRELMGQLSEVQSYLVEAVSGAASLKALNAEDSVYDEYEKREVKAVKINYRLGILSKIQSFLNSILTGWSSNIIFFVGTYLILKDQFTVGQLISFNALLGFFTGPLQRLLTLQPSLQEAFVAGSRLGEIFDLKKEIADEGHWIKPEKILGNIEIKDLIFRYGTRKPVLNKISLNINAGESIGFVGASGSGKTSLIKLLLKFYSPESGSIKIDGHNIEDIDTKTLRAKIGYVPQDIFLFSGTIAENISIHDDNASIEDIIRVSMETGVHAFVENLPERYNTVLAERGVSLSGGERQRIALARALISDPDLLIFDEATSNLDTISEKQIHGVIENIKTKKITTLMIAHRLTTVKNCDKIFVMQNGVIAEEGNHPSLLEKKGLYYRLWNGDVL